MTLCHKGIKKTLRVHRLVALSFIPNPDNLPIVDHIDRDRLNNYVGNLRWVTKSHNNYNNKNKYVGVSTIKENTHRVMYKGKYYGTYDTKYLAAKIFDVVASFHEMSPYLNFPGADLLCSYTDIENYKRTVIAV